MRVQRVVMPDIGRESWTLLGDDLRPVEPVERFLAYLAAIEKSPNTIKAYAHDRKDWWDYLIGHGVGWRSATLEDVAGFVAWLRLPPEARDGRVAVLPTVAHHCSASSVNRKLAGLTSFCEFHARHGVDLAGLLVRMQPAGRGSASSYKPFLHHVTKNNPELARQRVPDPARVSRVGDPGQRRQQPLPFTVGDGRWWCGVGGAVSHDRGNRR